MERWLAIVLACVAGLAGAGLGVGTTLYFVEQGPEGPTGERGRPGPPGPPGESFDADELQSQIDELYGLAEDGAATDDFQGQIEEVHFGLNDLDARISDLESLTDSMCLELELICY